LLFCGRTSNFNVNGIHSTRTIYSTTSSYCTWQLLIDLLYNESMMILSPYWKDSGPKGRISWMSCQAMPRLASGLPYLPSRLGWWWRAALHVGTEPMIYSFIAQVCPISPFKAHNMATLCWSSDVSWASSVEGQVTGAWYCLRLFWNLRTIVNQSIIHAQQVMSSVLLSIVMGCDRLCFVIIGANWFRRWVL